MERFSYISSPLKRHLQYSSVVDVLYENSVQFPSQEICIHIRLDGSRVAITFKELYSRSTKIAKYLISAGIKSGDHVAISGPNTLEWIVAECGILAAGAVATHVPILSTDPTYVKDMLKETGCKGLLFDPGTGSGVDSSPLLTAMDLMYENRDSAETELPIVVMFRASTSKSQFPVIQEILSREMASFDLPIIYPENTAVIFTTSGSTGRPKLAEMSHYAMVNASARIPPMLGEDKNKMKVYNDRPFGWIGGTPLGYMIRREPRVFIDALTGTTPERTCRIWEIIKEEKCTHCLFSPFFLTDLLANKKELLKMNYRMEVISTGGQLIGSKFKNIIGVFCDKFVVLYGSTEVNIVTHGDPLSPGDEIDIGNVGKPFEGVEIRIADENGRPLVVGEVGEIQVRSPFYLTGYYGYSEMNHESFTSDGHWFRTGDVGIINNKQELVIKGKAKDVIIRGMGKVFTGFIEEAMNNFESLQEVVVVSVPDDRLIEEVCACYVVKDGHHVSNEEVIAYSEHIFGRFSPDNLGNNPGYFLKFDVFPRLGTGKPDKVKIRELAIQRIHLRGKGGN